MARDLDRIESIENALEEAGLNALVCALPANVLLVSGYWPVVGASLAVITEEGYVTIIAPEDEREFAEKGWADELALFNPGSLSEIKPLVQSVRMRLREVAGLLGRGARVGFEEATYEPVSYVAQYVYNGVIRDLLAQVAPSAKLQPAGDLLARLRSILTAQEIQRVRHACEIAGLAFREGAEEMRTGLTEVEAASHFTVPLSTNGIGRDGVMRADGWTFCRSGANSSKAYAAFQQSTAREILPGELALVHCNSYADGMWIDVTRTYCLGDPDERKREMYESVLAARQVALNAIKPEVNAADVDRAARHLLEERGFGEQFRHPLGHGVGFSAIDHHARPCLHPASTHVLELGMVFNVEPAIYFPGYGGIRHCDTVLVTADGAEVLTPFQSRLEDLILD